MALASDLGAEVHWPAAHVTVADVTGAPLPAALVTLGGAIVLQAGPDGIVRVARTEAGPAEVRVHDPRSASRTLLLDFGTERLPSDGR